MSRRSRILSFGGAGLLVVAGAVCAAVIGGVAGEVLAVVLIGLGFVAATSLLFFEVGLSEDRELAREEGTRQTAARRAPRIGARVATRSERPRPRLRRMRGERRRLG